MVADIRTAFRNWWLTFDTLRTIRRITRQLPITGKSGGAR